MTVALFGVRLTLACATIRTFGTETETETGTVMVE
jgi:hypothetical protein